MAKKKLVTVSTKADASVTNVVSRIPLNIASIIIDRLRGSSLVDTLWSETVNTDYITHVLTQDGNELRDQLAASLMNGSVIKIYSDFIGVPTQRAGGVKGTKSTSYDACLGVLKNSALASLMNELLMPIYSAQGLVSMHSSYGVRRKVPYADVTTKMIADDMLKQGIVTAVKQASELFVVPNGFSSTDALAEMLAEAVKPIGVALTMISRYEDVIDDMVLGVLANIDPAPLQSQLGSIPHELRTNPVVMQLSTCWTFIDAALSLRTEINGAAGPSVRNASPKVNPTLFEKYADTLMAMIRSSERYAMVSRSHFVGDLGFMKVFDLRGIPVSTVLYHAANIEAMSMAVIKVDDVSLAGAINLQAAPDRVSERMATAYGDIEQYATTERAAAVMSDILTLRVEAGEEVEQLIVARLSSQEEMLSDRLMAAMFSDSVSASYDISADDQQVKSGYTLVYSGKTQYRALALTAGGITRDHYVTTSPAEVFLALDEKAPTRSVEAPPQAIPFKSLNTKLMGFDSSDFIEALTRCTYKINVNDVELYGTIRLQELTSIRMGTYINMVKPYFNSEVFSLIDEMLTSSYEMAKSITKSMPAQRRAKRIVAEYLIEMAQSLSPAFRNEIHSMIVEHAAKTLPSEESMRLRARLNQKSLKSAIDIVAATVLFKLQGLAETTLIDNMSGDEEVIDAWIDFGSDRD